jgi:hypothetical protein
MATATSAATIPPVVAPESIAPNVYAAASSAMAKPSDEAATRSMSQRREARTNIGRSIADGAAECARVGDRGEGSVKLASWAVTIGSRSVH